MTESPSKIFIVAGEASGDLHGAKLMAAMNNVQPSIQWLGHGGDAMKKEGLSLLHHIDSLSMMGFSEVLSQLPFMVRVMRETTTTIKNEKPDRIILVDYPGFNLRLIKQIAHLGIPVTYFILPQVWAWKQNRIEILKRYTSQCISIFPFELEWFESHGLMVDFVGHPFVETVIEPDRIDRFHKRLSLNMDSPRLILLPGSRQQEINRHWNIFLQTVQEVLRKQPHVQILLGKAPGVEIPSIPDFIKVETDDIPTAIQSATAALAASGTVTLETAVLDTPTVVCYRLSSVSWMLAKWFVHAPYASMANLIANASVVPEFLQGAMEPTSLAKALLPLLSNTPERKSMLSGFETIRRSLGVVGVYRRAAQTILDRMGNE